MKKQQHINYIDPGSRKVEEIFELLIISCMILSKEGKKIHNFILVFDR
jgi:hypothetical protein